MFTTLDQEQPYFSHHAAYPLALLKSESEWNLKHILCQILQKLREFFLQGMKLITKLLSPIQNSQIAVSYTELKISKSVGFSVLKTRNVKLRGQ